MKISKLLLLAERVVEETISQLPAEVRSLAEAIPVLLESRADMEDMPSDPEEVLLGLFEGPDHGDESQISGYSPKIFLYILSIWEVCEEDPTLFRKEIAKTYLHELGHYLGWGEEEVARRGLG